MKMSYKCDICGTTHESLPKYVECVNTCNTKEKQKEAQAKRIAEEQRQKKLREEVNADKANLEALQKQVLDAEEAFMKKYPNEPVTMYVPFGGKISVTGDYGFDNAFTHVFKPLFWCK
jgi:DNA-directed RNA polymerase subunit RPC12/RpoP